MDLFKPHNIMILSDYKNALYNGDIVEGYLSKSKKFLYVSVLSPETDELIDSLFKEDIKINDGYARLIASEIKVDHMEPRHIDKEEYIDHLRGKISLLEFYGYPFPNNGIIFNESLDIKLSYLRDFYENSLEKEEAFNIFMNAAIFDDFIEKGLNDYCDNKGDFFFENEKTIIALFMDVIKKYEDGGFIYDLDQIKKSLDLEVVYLDGKSCQRSYILKAMFIEKHSQEANYYMFDNISGLLDTYKAYLDDLISLNDLMATNAKAYLDYEGAFFWPTNYSEAEVLLKKIYLTGDASAANTLGYLYYYHNPNSQSPDYDKAFHYFSIAAAKNIAEARYKLTDCLLNGYGCEKNPRLAFNILGECYLDERKKFIEGNYLSKFADVALRTAKMYRSSVVVDEDYYKENMAKTSIIEAKYALEKRMQEVDYIGDKSVYDNINDIYSLYDFEEFEETLPVDDNLMLRRLLIDLIMMDDKMKHQVKLTFEPHDDDQVALTIQLPKKYDSKALLTFTKYGATTLVDKIIFLGYSPIKEKIKMNFDETEFELINHEDTPVMMVSKDASKFLLYPHIIVPPYLINKGELHKFVTVLFSDQHLSSHLPYMYLADNFDLKENDRVICPTISGPDQGVVYKVLTLYESELDMPLKDYNRIIRKDDSVIANVNENKLKDYVS